jgi:RNA polymerase sigma-70 factor (ECF subfamily)
VRQSTDYVTVSDSTEVSDLDLVRKAQAGDSEAFGDLVERNRRAVFRAALAAVGSATEADDVAQEAFVTAYKKLNSFRGEAAFRTWLLSITWRKAIDRRKSLTRWLRLTVAASDFDAAPVDLIETVASKRRSQEEDLSGAELQQRLRRLIAALPKKLRDPLLLAGSGDYTYEQISHMLDCPIGTLKWRVSEARRLLKAKLEVQR